jgi:hypothetical protein
VLYRTGMMNSEIAKHIESGVICYADSAEPKSIEEITALWENDSGRDKGEGFHFIRHSGNARAKLFSYQAQHGFNKGIEGLRLGERQKRERNEPPHWCRSRLGCV